MSFEIGLFAHETTDMSLPIFADATMRLKRDKIIYTVGHKKHTKMCFAITFVKLDGF